jgi:hypothetical protein
VFQFGAPGQSLGTFSHEVIEPEVQAPNPGRHLQKSALESAGFGRLDIDFLDPVPRPLELRIPVLNQFFDGAQLLSATQLQPKHPANDQEGPTLALERPDPFLAKTTDQQLRTRQFIAFGMAEMTPMLATVKPYQFRPCLVVLVAKLFQPVGQNLPWLNVVRMTFDLGKQGGQVALG